MIEGNLDLLCYIFVRLTIEGSSLGVTCEGIFDTSVLDHSSGKLSVVDYYDQTLIKTTYRIL